VTTPHPKPDELIDTLRSLRRDPTLESLSRATERVVHDLRVHQAELECQNHDLRIAQEALEAARARYADLFDFAPIGYLTFDRAGLVLEANLTAAALLGVERASLIGKQFAALDCVVSAKGFSEHLAAVFGAAPCATTDAVIHPKGGRPITVEMRSARNTNAPGKAPEQCRTALVDVTARRRDTVMLKLLADASEILVSSLDHTANIAAVARLIVPTLGDACFVDVPDATGRLRRLQIVSGDPAQQALVTLLERPLLSPRSDSPQARAMKLVAPELLHGSEASAAVPIELVEACGEPASALVVPLVARDTVHGVLTLLMFRSGRVQEDEDMRYALALARRFACSIDNAKLYREAQRAIRAREEILSTVSHDLRNSLSSIVMNTSLMLSAAPPRERRRDQRRLEMLQRGAQRMQRMTEDLIDLCAIESGQLAVDTSKHKIDDILHEVQGSLGPLARDKDQRFELRPLGRDTWVTCDRDRVLQIFANLVSNAVKYTPANGRITVSAERFDAFVRLSVQDDGSGMDDNELRHLFDRYWRAEQQRKTTKGLGIGLDICKGLVESQGGTIWAESRKGQGTTFFFTLPRCDGAPERVTKTGPLRVLVVDDNEQVRSVLEESLAEKGCAVLCANDGVEALELLRSTRLDLILVDLDMPRLDGRALVAQLAANPEMPRASIVFMSCGRMSENEARGLGAEGFLHKPFDVASVIDLVAAASTNVRTLRLRS